MGVEPRVPIEWNPRLLIEPLVFVREKLEPSQCKGSLHQNKAKLKRKGV
jgi:hypothetical protein